MQTVYQKMSNLLKFQNLYFNERNTFFISYLQI